LRRVNRRWQLHGRYPMPVFGGDGNRLRVSRPAWVRPANNSGSVFELRGRYGSGCSLPRARVAVAGPSDVVEITPLLACAISCIGDGGSGDRGTPGLHSWISHFLYSRRPTDGHLFAAAFTGRTVCPHRTRTGGFAGDFGSRRSAHTPSAAGGCHQPHTGTAPAVKARTLR
jgi:hypothetical protein